MLGDVDGGPAPLAAERHALDQPQGDEEDRREQAGLAVGGQEADGEGRAPHHRHGDQERALAALPVADAAEDQRAERAEGEAGREGAEREDIGRRLVQPGEEHPGDNAGQRHEDEEVVPLEGRAGGRGHDHEPDVSGVRAWRAQRSRRRRPHRQRS